MSTIYHSQGEQDAHVRLENPTTRSDENSGDFDETKEVDIEKVADSKDSSGSISPCRSKDDDDDDERIIIGFDRDDKENPYNWSNPKKLYVVVTCIFMVINSTMGSAIPSGATTTIEKYFDVRDPELLVLPISIYLIGYILGPVSTAMRRLDYVRHILTLYSMISDGLRTA